MVPIRKKLIEVALPLEAINAASAREKSIRHGHPSTLHLWWARRPLAAARAVIFAQMVDDPSANPDLFPTERAQQKERQRLFRIIEDLVKWENTTNEAVLNRAREEIWQSWRRTCAENADHPRAKELFDRNVLPAFHDPFAGGGALPLEAQRLGLVSYASDLNPVAVLINKAMIEIPPKFAGRPPINPESRKNPALLATKWKGAQGLAEDVRYYGKWMRDEAEKRIGHLYPKIEVTEEMAKDRKDLKPYVGQKLTVIAWLWARTVKSPNPAFAHVDVPLASTFMLSTKAGKEAFVEVRTKGDAYEFVVRKGRPKNPAEVKNGTKLARGANFRCVMSDTVITDPYVKRESMAGRLGSRTMAIVAEAGRGRIYLSPNSQHEETARRALAPWKPDEPMNRESSNLVSGRGYGFFVWSDLFTGRQLALLTTLTDLVREATERIRHDVGAALPSISNARREDSESYSAAVVTYLALAVSKLSDAQSSLCRWKASMDQSIASFGRQALPMVWDYSEANGFGQMAGDFSVSLHNMMRVLEQLPANVPATASQADAQTQSISVEKVVSTDPPYYDNIAYADLSDYFYIWMRHSLRAVWPDLFATVAVPKKEELVATPYRQGGEESAEAFFLGGMKDAMARIATQAHRSFPVTIYYAYKQSETDQADGISSTGWETFLEAVIGAGLGISGTWPVRTELSNRIVGLDRNALASSVVLVCRHRTPSSATATRRDFVQQLRSELPAALSRMRGGNIAPVDLAQASIGPGMAIYTRYSQVLDSDGQRLGVGAALSIINQALGEALTEDEGDFDPDSRWAIAWFEQYGFGEAEFGDADVLARAQNTSVQGIVDAGVAASKRGKVRLLKADELPADWDPETDARLSAWETVHHLIRALQADGEPGAAALMKKLGARAEVARELAYRLYSISDRKKRAAEALAYNGLVQSWLEIARLAQETQTTEPARTKDLFDE